MLFINKAIKVILYVCIFWQCYIILSIKKAFETYFIKIVETCERTLL